MTNQLDYQDMLYALNYTGAVEGTSFVPGISLGRNASGCYIIDYTVFKNISDVNAANYYAGHSVLSHLATTTYLTSVETAFLGIVSQGETTWGSSFEDVAQIEFQEAMSGVGIIGFGQVTQDLTVRDKTLEESDISAFQVPYISGGIEASKVKGDIWVNSEHGVWGADNPGTPGTSGYKTLLEEIMHSLGVDVYEEFDVDGDGEKDPRNAALDSHKYSVTSYKEHPDMDFDGGLENDGPYPTGLGLFDIAALQAIYGANMTTRTGNTIYDKDGAFASSEDNNAFVYSIWDAGGIDTIDASGYDVGAQIDLREGRFSSIGYTGNELTDASVAWDSGAYDAGNVSIAYGAKIENAVGTAEDDDFIGNDLNNVLDGKDGDDTYFGGKGYDQFVIGYNNDGNADDNVILDYNLKQADIVQFENLTSVTEIVGSKSGDNLVLSVVDSGATDTVTLEDFFDGGHNKVFGEYRIIVGLNGAGKIQSVFVDPADGGLSDTPVNAGSVNPIFTPDGSGDIADNDYVAIGNPNGGNNFEIDASSSKGGYDYLADRHGEFYRHRK